MCNRKIGVELEICGQAFDQGHKILKDTKAYNLGWVAKGDNSIPQYKWKRSCVCDEKNYRCKHCGNKQETCECCLCYFTCPGCGYNTGFAYIKRYYATHCPSCGTSSTLRANKVAEARKACNCKKDEAWKNRRECKACYAGQKMSGYEIVSPPMSSKLQFKMLEKVLRKIKETSEKNKINLFGKSSVQNRATGLHIHVDLSDLPPLGRSGYNYDCYPLDSAKKSRAKLALLNFYIQERYDKLHQLFPKVLPLWRKNWYYSRFVPTETQSHKTMSLYKLFDRLGSYDRYVPVNVYFAYQRHTTAEFRIGYMTDNIEQLIGWARYCQQLVDFVVKSKHDFTSETISSGVAKLDELLVAAHNAKTTKNKERTLVLV